MTTTPWLPTSAELASHTKVSTELVAAAESLNKAALLLSDCGMADRARELCWRQFDLFRSHSPLAPRTAKLALQPLVNIGRLQIRTGDEHRAHELFTGLYQAMRGGAAIRIDDRVVDTANLLDDRERRSELVRFLWTVLLADGTRALTRAGRWEHALAHIECHRGIGERLLNGRQVAIITGIVNGDHDHALELLDRSGTHEPWEQAIADCLATLCLTLAGRDTQLAEHRMLEHYLDLGTTPPVFRCRLGLVVLDLLRHAPAAPIAANITQQAISAGDAYVARDVDTHRTCMVGTSAATRQQMSTIVTDGGLGHDPYLPAALLDTITDAAAASEEGMSRFLRGGCR
ncbi:hypothetical protein GCM10009676_06710 [Prauserella halophila]|uniref:Uncharacterized protein n=1 Tax=Prauserella halophila TaxID=185641 RepID=A0ABP4GJU0_9PSEU|nr:hypothetical protein [Prauserella halophila]MCP2237278.1 hypothetical protein [Prauserella halophila]